MLIGNLAAAVPDITEAGTAEEDSSAPVAGPSTPYEVRQVLMSLIP